MSKLSIESAATTIHRRFFLGQSARGLGVAALSSLLARDAGAAPTLGPPAKAKRVIYLFQSGGPSQLELYDYKPQLDKLQQQEVPASVFNGQRLTGMTAGQSSFPVARSVFPFEQCGKSGMWLNRELMPHLSEHADDLCLIRSLHTDAINHDPAITFFQTGFQIAGRPSVGAWLSYGLGSENDNLPSFVAMTSNRSGQPLYDRLWGAGFLPSQHQGVRFRSGADPVLYLNNPPGMPAEVRRQTLDLLRSFNEQQLQSQRDPEIATRIAQYELAARMQTAVPELTDVSDEPESTFDLYGKDAQKPGTYAYNCLLARRLSERGVRFVQLFHRGWDTHSGLPGSLAARCRETDQATAGLLADLKQRGLLDETLVVWGGEFGRTVYCQGELTAKSYGRDHHPRCFSVWMAGGGTRGGLTWGETDDYSYNIVRDPVSVHDLHATMLRLLGIDHTRLTYRFQGRDYRLTDIHGEVVDGLLNV
ncbi:MAG: DUF1501 domain-containing protein [Planctomycetales bacterium]|nr:DUF1501 domain-containing protein [Planctomycetales bacterium]